MRSSIAAAAAAAAAAGKNACYTGRDKPLEQRGSVLRAVVRRTRLIYWCFVPTLTHVRSPHTHRRIVHSGRVACLADRLQYVPVLVHLQGKSNYRATTDNTVLRTVNNCTS